VIDETVPGSFELPMGARILAASGEVDAVICLGCVIRGETSHYDLVAGESAAGIQQVQLTTGVPVAFGILATEDEAQALARSEGPAATTSARMPPRSRSRWPDLAQRHPQPIRVSGPRGHATLDRRAAPRAAQGIAGEATLELFEAADLRVERSSTSSYKASIDDPRIDEVRILRPQEIPTYVAEGLFDLGIAGRDWVEETASDVTILGELQYSKASSQPFQIVLASRTTRRTATSPTCPRRAGVERVPRAHPQFFEKHGIQADIRLSYGRHRGEGARHRGLHRRRHRDGSRLRAAGLKIIGDVLTSYTAPDRQPGRGGRPGQAARHGADQDAPRRRDGGRGKVLVKLNVGPGDLDAVIAILPSMKSPTVSELFGEGGYAVETVVPRSRSTTLILPSRTPAPPTSSSCRSPRSSIDRGWRRHRVRRAAGPGHDRVGRHRVPVPLHRAPRWHPHGRGRHAGDVRRATAGMGRWEATRIATPGASA
jgi:ATP phosphoribosyltransferase